MSEAILTKGQKNRMDLIKQNPNETLGILKYISKKKCGKEYYQ